MVEPTKIVDIFMEVNWSYLHFPHFVDFEGKS
jgi:hypothetical protein